MTLDHKKGLAHSYSREEDGPLGYRWGPERITCSGNLAGPSFTSPCPHLRRRRFGIRLFLCGPGTWLRPRLKFRVFASWASFLSLLWGVLAAKDQSLHFTGWLSRPHVWISQRCSGTLEDLHGHGHVIPPKPSSGFSNHKPAFPSLTIVKLGQK